MIRRLPAILATALTLPAALSAQSGRFVVRLGRDTLAIEQYARSADRLQGEQVVRTPRTTHKIYTATFGPGGSVQRFEVVTHNVSGAPGSRETRATMDFAGDTAVSAVPDGDSTRHRRVPCSAGGVPWTFHSYALVAEIARRARGAGGMVEQLKLPVEPFTIAVEPRGSGGVFAARV